MNRANILAIIMDLAMKSSVIVVDCTLNDVMMTVTWSQTSRLLYQVFTRNLQTVSDSSSSLLNARVINSEMFNHSLNNLTAKTLFNCAYLLFGLRCAKCYTFFLIALFDRQNAATHGY
jgi:uncharacterized membrane protein